MSVTEIQTQPDFPRIDVLDENALALELALQNGGILDRAHTAAEQDSLLYELTHTVARQSGDQFPSDHDVLAFSYGLKLYEGMSALLEHENQIQLFYTIRMATRALREALLTNRSLSFLVDARDEMAQAQPVANELIKTVSQRHFVGKTDLVTMGAGIARQTEVEAIAFDEAARLHLLEKEFQANPDADTIQ